MRNDTARLCANGHDLAVVGVYKVAGANRCRPCHRETLARSKKRLQEARSHELELATPKEHARFWRKVNKTETCWTWTGAVHGMGYGVFQLAGKPQLAHRVSYFNFVGATDDDLEIDHLCMNKICMNPAHLEQVTHRVNCARALERRAA